MQPDFDRIQYLVGSRKILEQMETVPAFPLFFDKVLGFLDCLSKKLMESREARQYPDVIAYAFWIRKAHMEQARMAYQTGAQRVGRGIAFQIAPSNIPVQFAVSMTYALIAGNASIVRISDKEFEQVDIICQTLRAVMLDAYPCMAPYICIVRYAHDDTITQLLSDMCGARMIWGSNSTISAIRKTQARPRCLDLGFADRYSIAVIDSDDYLKQDRDAIARDFYNDTYFSDQNACSSPRLVVWTGHSIPEAKEVFWGALADMVSEKYKMDPICASEKLLKVAVCAARYPGVKAVKKDNLLVRIELPVLYEDIMGFRGNCGFFFECNAERLTDIVPILKEDCQTIAYIGGIEEELRKVIANSGAKGVDRIVRVGHAADISFVWDGLDLPNVLSRQIGNS